MVNKIILQGRLTADPTTETKGGFKMCEFTVAWSEKIKEVEKNCFLRCKVWRNTAEFLEKYFKKGQEIVIEGQLSTESWEKDGQKQSRTICNVEKINFCGPKSDGSSSSNSSNDFMNIPETIAEELPFN